MRIVDGTDNRVYEVSEDGSAVLMGRQSEEDLLAEMEGEMAAEFGSSWVFGGGAPEDAAAAYRQFRLS